MDDPEDFPDAEADELTPLARYWILRILVPLGRKSELCGKHGFTNDALALALGLGRWLNDPAPDTKSVHACLRRQYARAFEARASAAVADVLAANVRMLSQLVDLSDTESRLLEFAVMLNTDGMLSDATDWLGNMSTNKVLRTLANLLELSLPAVRASLDSGSVLVRSGLLCILPMGSSMMSSKLNLLSPTFADRMCSEASDPQTLLRGLVAAGLPPGLVMADFAHVADSLAVMRSYLRPSLDASRRGVNLLVYGPPGTGKTELARALAADMGCDLFEVASADSDGDVISGTQRMRTFTAVQCFFKRRRAMILFDEVEDVFERNWDHHGNQKAQKGKAWINRLLEENNVPAIWLSNSIDCLDAAFVRRFDVVMELPVPPEGRRREIIAQACQGLVDARSVARLAQSEHLAPGVISRAADVARVIGGTAGAPPAAAAIEMMVGNTLEAQGHARPRRHNPDALPELYDPAFIRCDADLAALGAGLVRTRSARLCLYGPPGTGKTAWGRWLAGQLQCTLMVRRASDLMSMWVGGSEKKVADAFREAERDGAVLLIDEVDSFLQDRRGARNSWEVTLVNEMLTQMESFPGVFIASTNLMDSLDQAALRRFDLKLEFGFLRGAQAAALLAQYCRQLELAGPEEGDLARVAGFNKLTPGDFAAVARRHRFGPLADAGMFVAALSEECAIKQGSVRQLGFLPA